MTALWPSGVFVMLVSRPRACVRLSWFCKYVYCWNAGSSSRGGMPCSVSACIRSFALCVTHQCGQLVSFCGFDVVMSASRKIAGMVPA